MSEYTLDWLVGDALSAVERRQFDSWGLQFASGGSLVVQCPWRLIEDEAIRLSSADDQQKYGLPAPIDAAVELLALLAGDTIAAVHVAQKSGDIRMRFASGKELHVLPFSSGYEAWESWSPEGFNVIAQGGQTLVGFKP